MRTHKGTAVNYEKLGVWVAAVLFFLIVLEGFWEKLVNERSIFQEDQISNTLGYGCLFLFPLFLGTTVVAHIAVQKARGSWDREKPHLKWFETLLGFLIFLYVIVFGLFISGWNGGVRSWLCFFVPLLIAFLYITFFYKLGKSLQPTFKRLVFDLALLFGIPFLVLVFLMNLFRFTLLLK